MEMRNAISITLMVLVCGHLLQGVATTKGQAEQKSVASGVRSVNLGVYVLYDKYVTMFRNRHQVTFNLTAYFSLLIGMAEKTYFANITCTNISLFFLGSSELEESSGVEVPRHAPEVEPTLANLANYSFQHRKDFGNPDLTVLFTGLRPRNNTELCRTGSGDDPQVKAYCLLPGGAAYYKEMCTNKSVAIVYDTSVSTAFLGATGLARQIATLMGVGHGILKNKSECPNEEDYFTSSAFITPAYIKYPGLSQCAEKELNDFIESTSNSGNVCWNDTPNTTISGIGISPDNIFETVDFCRWEYRKYNVTTCNVTTVPGTTKRPCTVDCCWLSTNCTEENRTAPGCQKPLRFRYPPPGTSCGRNGVCFYGECFERTY